jgi:hypothetical protein
LPDTTRALTGVIEFDKINQTLIGMIELQDQVNAHGSCGCVHGRRARDTVTDGGQ